MNFSKKVKAELIAIRELKANIPVLEYGKSYGVSDVCAAANLISDRVLGGGSEIGGIFLRGVFLACGSVTDPNKDYHLELVPPNAEKCDELLDFVTDRGLYLKRSERKPSNGEPQAFLYCKGNERISDFLTFIGATKHAMDIMNVTILKGIRNNVNRVVNCEVANLEKITRVAEAQIRDIEYVLECESKSKRTILSEQLREVALLRLKNAGMSLSEIGAELDVPLSKSGVNHRLRKISDIAEKLRNEFLSENT